MRGPYGFEMSENCQTCKLRKSGFFCQLPPRAMKDFESVKSVSAYPEGAVLFLEKQDARGVFLLCEGKVKLTISSSEGKTLILRIAKPGEILGLMAGLVGLGFGLNHGLEAGELPLYAEIPIFIVTATATAQFLTTIARRLEPPLYVALWYLIGAFVWTTMNWKLQISMQIINNTLTCCE